MGTRNPLDRSAAHEALLYTSAEFPKADLNRSSQLITEFLEDFYASDSKNMYDFATTWRQGPPPVSPPDVPPAPRQARAEVRDGRMRVRKGGYCAACDPATSAWSTRHTCGLSGLQGMLRIGGR